VAAEAARHPDPAAFALFASSVLPGVERDVARFLVGKRGGLSSLDIDRLSRLLVPHPLPNELASRRRPPPEPSPEVGEYIYNRRRGALRCFKLQMSRFASSPAELGYTMSFTPYMVTACWMMRTSTTISISISWASQRRIIIALALVQNPVFLC
jgi:hypothetical protein